MKSNCLFSVIIPLYNKADTIARTLCSVQAQTCRDFEVVVVDDGSTDDGVMTAEKYQDCFSLKVVHQLNSGVSVARNTGVNNSHGEYLAFLDADDEWLPGYLEEIKRMMDEFPHAEVYGTNYFCVSGQRLVINRPWGRTRKLVDFQKAWTRRCPIHTSSSVVKRGAFTAVGGFVANHTYYEDAELLFKLSMRGKFCVSLVPLLRYNTDATVRATGTTKPYCAYAHWCLLEEMLLHGVNIKGFRRVARSEIQRRLTDNFLHNRVDISLGIKSEFPLMFRTVGYEGDLLLNRHNSFSWILAICNKLKYFVLSRLVTQSTYKKI